MLPSEAAVGRSWKNYLQPGIVVLVVASWLLLQDSVSLTNLSLVLMGGALVTIQSLEFVVERHASARLDGREFLTDVFYTIVMTAIAVLLYPIVAEWIWKLGVAVGTDSLWPTNLPFLVNVVLCLALVELGQYWMHRLMHASFLWRVHGPHHHITQLNALKAYVGQPIELLLVQLGILPMIGAPLDAQLLTGAIIVTTVTFAHANIAGNPPRWFSFFFTSYPQHSIHHCVGLEETRCNYANAFILWDRVFGTFAPGEAAPGTIGQGTRVRLSIPQQWAFSFRAAENVELPLLKSRETVR